MIDQAQLSGVLTKVCIFLMFASAGVIFYGLAIVEPILIPVITVGAFFFRYELSKLAVYLIQTFSYICGLFLNSYTKD